MIGRHSATTSGARRPRQRATVRTAALLIVTILCAACSSDEKLNSARLGGLPYPGMFTLYAEADADELGTHQYPSTFITSLLAEEQSRGILYTCRAGFLDLSHTRDTIDLTRYYYLAYTDALREGEDSTVVYGLSPCRYHITFNLPQTWKHRISAAVSRDEPIPPEINDALIELAVQTTWIATTYYELLQWYGYKSSGVFSERRSAFTYDDMMAHVVGGNVARVALQRSEGEDTFNEAVTRTLDRTLDELDVVSVEASRRAVRLIEGHWWQGSRAVRRQLDIGLDDGALTPWLVRDLEYCDDHNPQPFDVPPLIDALRPDGRPLATLEIEMRVFESSIIRRAIPDRPTRIVPPRDFPILLDDVRKEMTEEFGEDFDQPYPDAPKRAAK